MNRVELLDAARVAVATDREKLYGAPGEHFTLVAALWSADLGITLTAVDVVRLLVFFKGARSKANPRHADSWVDVAGYAALGGELTAQPRREPESAAARPPEPAIDFEMLAGPDGGAPSPMSGATPQADPKASTISCAQASTPRPGTAGVVDSCGECDHPALAPAIVGQDQEEAAPPYLPGFVDWDALAELVLDGAAVEDVAREHGVSRTWLSDRVDVVLAEAIAPGPDSNENDEIADGEGLASEPTVIPGAAAGHDPEVGAGAPPPDRPSASSPLPVIEATCDAAAAPLPGEEPIPGARPDTDPDPVEDQEPPAPPLPAELVEEPAPIVAGGGRRHVA